MLRIRTCLFALALWTLVSSTSIAADADVDFFESKIRPVLVEKCYSCHSDDAEKSKKLRGGLKLDSREALRKGGDSGVVVVPGKPKESLLLKSLRYEGELQMPPSGKLTANVVADFEKWIASGAVDPREKTSVETSKIDIEKGRTYWAFQQPKAASPPTQFDAKRANWPKTDIDRFILAKLQDQKLTPSPIADKHTLLRRVYLDVIGLPPTPEEAAAFEKDQSPEAFSKVVEKLLASPHYGERWARVWLDVARYAEDQAHTFGVRPKNQAWRYRDWVIQAFNADMPYDQFVKFQLAGDLLPGDGMDPAQRYAGLGFLGLGAEYYKNTAREQAIADELDDRVDTVTRGFLAVTVSCARCHDHKFDPIPQRDYYSIAGIFAGSNMSDAQLGKPEEVKAYNEAQNKMKQTDDKLKKMQAEAKKLPKDQKLQDEVKALTDELAKIKKEMPPAPPVAHVLSGGGTGMKVFVRGNPLNPGEPAPKGFLQVLNSPKPAKDPKDFNRLDLANAIATRDNPLTARVIVNRIWQAHFGRGLVNTPSNFGSLGDRPSHPELLDTLAVRFMEQGWSIKWLQRQILNSAVYQQTSANNTANANIDGSNVYLWRMNRHRHDVETWRDSVLAIAGTLDTAMGGPTFNLKDANSRKRTVYAKVSRHELDGLLRLFDFPDANVTADRRSSTTVPQQQLFVLNSEFMVNQAKAFAERIEKAAKTEEDRVRTAYQMAFTRAPSAAELKLGVAFVNAPADPTDKLTRWQQYAQILLASNELMYVD